MLVPGKDQLETILKNNILIVKFKKLDGDERIMTCTKDLQAIPKEKHPKNESKIHENTISVYDINALDWRSFRYDRIISLEEFKAV